MNYQYVTLIKFQGSFVCPRHEEEDKLFIVWKGGLRTDFIDRRIWLEEGEFLGVPHGVDHCPVAAEETGVVLFEPVSILNTGDVQNEKTVKDLERI